MESTGNFALEQFRRLPRSERRSYSQTGCVYYGAVMAAAPAFSRAEVALTKHTARAYLLGLRRGYREATR